MWGSAENRSTRTRKKPFPFYGAYEILEKSLSCTIPEKPDLELLHEERNSIQHKYLNPSADDAAFHVERAMKFIDRFVREELKLALGDFISSEFLTKVI